jgi:predicted ATPase
VPTRIIVNVGRELPSTLTFHPHHEVLRARKLVRRSLGGQVQEVTTHSEAFVNELASMISTCKLATDEVEIRMWEGVKVGEGKCRTFRFDREGHVTGGWPVGFFSGYDVLDHDDDIMSA